MERFSCSRADGSDLAQGGRLPDRSVEVVEKALSFLVRFPAEVWEQCLCAEGYDRGRTPMADPPDRGLREERSAFGGPGSRGG